MNSSIQNETSQPVYSDLIRDIQKVMALLIFSSVDLHTYSDHVFLDGGDIILTLIDINLTDFSVLIASID